VAASVYGQSAPTASLSSSGACSPEHVDELQQDRQAALEQQVLEWEQLKVAQRPVESGRWGPASREWEWALSGQGRQWGQEEEQMVSRRS